METEQCLHVWSEFLRIRVFVKYMMSFVFLLCYCDIYFNESLFKRFGVGYLTESAVLVLQL